MSSLYRPEALANRRNRLYGEVAISVGNNRSWLIILLSGLSFGMIAYASFAEYSRIEIVPGVVNSISPATKIYAQKTGVVKSISVVEGEHITPGRRLATITLDYVSGSGEQTAAGGLDVLEQQIAIVKSQLQINGRAFAQDRERLNDSIAQSKLEEINIINQIDLQKEVLDSAEKMFNVYAKVVEGGHVSRLEYERRRQAYLQEGQRLNQLEQQLYQNRGQRKTLLSQKARLLTDEARQAAEINSNLKALEGNRSKLRGEVDYEILSPITGRVSNVSAATGKAVDARYPLMVIIPEDPTFYAEAYVPTRAAGFLREGLKVRVMFDAFPYEKFGSFDGVVEFISRSILAPSEIETPVKLEEATYKIKIKLIDQKIASKGELLRIQSGMTLKATIVLEKRNLLERMLDPINLVRNRL